MGDIYVVTDNTSGISTWQAFVAASFLSASSLCIVELVVLTIALWNSKLKIFYCSIAIATASSLFFTIGVLVYFFAPPSDAAKIISVVLGTIGYWIYTPAQFMVMYARLHLLQPSQRVLMICKIVLISVWAFIITPNTILSAAALLSREDRFGDSYSYSQRIEPAFYASTCILLSSVYIYYAFNMFPNHYNEKRTRSILYRLVYANLFLIGIGVGDVIAEYVGGGVVQSAYSAFMYSLQLKIEFWMLHDMGLLTSESLERLGRLKPYETETTNTTGTTIC